MSLIASNIGYDNIIALDHDLEYLKILNSIISELEIINIKPTKYSFGDDFESSDVVVMLALIHWIYSCTSLYGSFDLIFEYLSNHVSYYLIIEWIDPTDNAIKLFNHIKFNTDIIETDYTEVNFRKSIEKNIGDILKIYDVDGSSRRLNVIKVIE